MTAKDVASDDSGLKLFRSVKDETRWFAFGPEIGWVAFPAEVDGWQKRQPARGLDPLYVREVPLQLGFNTGIPGAPTSKGRRVAASIRAVANA